MPSDQTPPESQRILTPLTEAAIFLVLTVAPGGEETVRELLADVSGLKRSVGFRIPEGELACVTGIGSGLWDRLFPHQDKPSDLHPFPGFTGARHTAPSTPGDLLFHIRAHRLDLCFELATRLTDRLDGAAKVADEIHGFRSFDERDLLGFVDGTENPEGQAAVDAVAIDAEPGYINGSYVIVQKYLHDMSAWNALSIEEQERVIGRTKLDDIEMPDDVKPANSHVALNVIEDDDGVQQQIMRFNMPFGRIGAGEFGTYFIGYAKTAALIEQMLTNMFIGNPPGNYDRVLDFSTAITGSLFFVPDADFLDDPPEAGESASTAVAPAGATATPQINDESLQIGSLKEDRP